MKLMIMGLIALGLQAQTKITPALVTCGFAPLPGPGGQILLFAPGVCIQADPTGFVLDKTSIPWILRVAGPVFVDNVPLTGTIDGTNVVFTLPSVPNPPASLMLHRNGIMLTAGTDFTLAAAVVTFLEAAAPQPGDGLIASYRK